MKDLLPTKHRDDPAILALAIPALGSLAIDPLVSLVDTAFVGQLGTAPLGALGVNSAVFAFTFLIFNFLAYGTTPQISRALGRDEHQEAGRIVVQALTLATLVGAMATAVLLLFTGPILSLMGATGDLTEPAATYLKIRAFAGPAVLIILASNGAFRGHQDTKTPLYVGIAFNVINLVLDPLLIFGVGWGIAGAATATVIAQWAGALIFLWLLFFRHRQTFQIPLIVPRPVELVPLIQIGGHMLIRTGSLIATMTFATAVAARLGVIEVAAHQVTYQLWGFLALIVDSLAIAAQTLLARHIGSDDPRAARRVGNRLLQWGLAVGIALGLLFWFARPHLVPLFTDDPQTTALITTTLIFVVVLQPLNGLVFVWDGLFIGLEAFRYLAITMVIAAFITAGLLGATLWFDWGLIGVWWAITAMMLIRLLSLGLPWLTSRVP